MTLKPGSKGVLDGQDGAQLLWLGLAPARCSKKGLELTALSSMEKEDQPFCLVEAIASSAAERCERRSDDAPRSISSGLAQARSSGSDDFRRGSELCNSIRPSRPSCSACRKARAADSGEELEDLTTQLKKNWLGSGTADEKAQKLQDRASSSKHRSRRFALIERKKASKSGGAPSRQGQDAMIQAAMQTGAQSKASWPFSLRSLSRKNARAGGTEAVQGAEIETALQTAAAASQQKSGKKMFRHPVKYIRRFVKSVEEELGAQDKPFRWALPS